MSLLVKIIYNKAPVFEALRLGGRSIQLCRALVFTVTLFKEEVSFMYLLGPKEGFS